MNGLVRLSVAAVFAALLEAGSALPSSPAGTPFTIDVIAPLTGIGAFQGASITRSLRVFEAWTNEHGGLRGQPIHFEIHDDQSNPAMSVQLTEQLKSKQPAVILGTSGSGNCNAQIPLAHDGPVVYCLAPSIHPPKGGYVFSASIAVDPFVNGMIRYLRLRGFHRLGIISSTDGSGATDDDSTRKSLALAENRDVEIVAWEHFNPTDLNVAAQAARIKSANPQALLVWTSGTPFGTVLRSLSDAGVSLPVETTNANANVSQLRQYAPFLPPELLVSGYQYILPPNLVESRAMRKPLADMFQAHREQNLVPDAGSIGTVWDPALIVLSGLQKLGPGASATALRDYILGLRGFAGIDGVYDFSIGDQHGLSDRSVVVSRWMPQTGEFVAASGPGGVPR
jgi:branched-chain amino acid transport system substrate-binding protein